MDRSAKRRWAVLLVVLAVTVVAAIAPVDVPTNDVVGLANEASKADRIDESDRAPREHSPKKKPPEFYKGDPFELRQWVELSGAAATISAPSIELPSPAPVIVDMPPAPPTAPPLPYRFAGRFTDGSEQTFYLSRRDQLVIVKNGDTLESEYRIVGVDDQRIQFQFLATGEIQSLSLPPAEK
jgi:hypothetical protein